MIPELWFSGIFVNCFLSRANSSIKSLAREGFSQFMPPYRTITSNEEPELLQLNHLITLEPQAAITFELISHRQESIECAV
ncbi:MAG: hypothetical protein GPJ32_14330 [Microcystis aeruginosa L311-01]|nr:hypothetical protein [Microcystis aeruginosa L311-01]